MKKLSPQQQAIYNAVVLAHAAKRSQAVIESIKHSHAHIRATYKNLYPTNKDEKLVFFMRYPGENFYYVFDKAFVIMEIQEVNPMLIRVARQIKGESFTHLIHVTQLVEICKELKGKGYFAHIADQVDNNKWNIWGPPTAPHETINTAIGAYEFNKN